MLHNKNHKLYLRKLVQMFQDCSLKSLFLDKLFRKDCIPIKTYLLFCYGYKYLSAKLKFSTLSYEKKNDYSK